MKIFENVAQLKLAKLKAGQFVETGGQLTPNDGLGVRFYVSETGTASGDDIVELAGGTFASTVVGATRYSSTPQMWSGLAWVDLV